MDDLPPAIRVRGLPPDEGVEPATWIRPSRGWIGLHPTDLWRHRELVYFLAWRDVKVRYKQTALGVSWAIIQPLSTMIVFSIFFGRLAGVPADGLPYPIFTLAALVPWTLFANGMNQSAASVVASENIIRKVYFPRLAIPIATVGASLVDFALALFVLLSIIPFYGVRPSVDIVWLPVFIALALVTTLGVGLWLAALNVLYRDVRYLLPFLTQFWLFVTPIAYPSSLLPPPWRAVYGLNPMAGVVEGFRWTLLGTGTPPILMMLVSAAVAFALLAGGAMYFRRMEKVFADVV